MKKGDRIEAFVGTLGVDGTGWPPCYVAYFACFNAGDYYEAHDVLEHLWLEETGPDFLFYKGLIQFAGAFVHLRKQHEHPLHPTHGRRLAPAARLFDLAARNLAPFAPRHLGLDVDAVLAVCRHHGDAIRESSHRRNPWSPNARPQLTPDWAS